VHVVHGERHQHPHHPRKFTFDLPYTPPNFALAAFTEAPDQVLQPAPADGYVPGDFYSSTNFPTYVKKDGRWHLVKRQRMDACIVWDEKANEFACIELRKVRAGQTVATGTAEDGSTGLLVHHTGFVPPEMSENTEAFKFMGTGASRERPLNYRRLAELIHWDKSRAGRSIWVLGPAVVHAGARDCMAWLIEHGYVGAVFGGNAVAVHDLERALYGTALGMDLEGHTVSGGHRHHMDAINTIRRYGSIAAAVQAGVVKDGIMKACVATGVPFLLAGSIRDDGPLPGVITDVVEAQDKMRMFTQGATLVVMLATMLHSIATGNMLSTFIERDGKVEPVYTIAVDQMEMVIHKLEDRGTHQAFGVTRNVDDFINRIVGELKNLESEEQSYLEQMRFQQQGE
jgi:lysine-ketoglutarate reductase/saccharopine dehydrogenase-like protein (TIGR00300 family)